MASPYSTAFIAMTLMIITSAALSAGDNSDPVFTITDAPIKAFNITSGNRLFCILNFSVLSFTGAFSVSYGPMEVNVNSWEGNETIADDVVMSSLPQGPWSDMLMAVEAVGLQRQLKRKTADAIRAEIQAAGVLRVNVRASASMDSATGVGVRVFCRKVEVHFVSEFGFREVTCSVDVSHPPPPSGGQGG